jgi:hypothetical protein
MKGIKREGFASRLSTAIIGILVLIFILEFILRRVIVYLILPLIDYSGPETFQYILLGKNIVVICSSLWIIYFGIIWVRDGSISFKKIFNGNDKTEDKI